MKAIYFLLFLPFISLAQSNFVVQLEGQNEVLNGLVHTEIFTPSSPNYSGEIISVHFNITNLTGTDQQCTITQRRIERPTNWFESLMWNVHVNPSSDLYETPNSLGNPTYTILNGTNQTSDGNLAQLGVHLYMSSSATDHALYRYYITNASTHEFLDSVDLEINAVLGIDELTEQNITISPNPSQGTFHLNLDNTTIETIIIYNQEGKRIALPRIDSNSSFDLRLIDDGLYWAEFILNDGSIIRKQIIIKE